MVATAILAAKGIVALGNLDLPEKVAEQQAPVYILNPEGTLQPR